MVLFQSMDIYKYDPSTDLQCICFLVRLPWLLEYYVPASSLVPEGGQQTLNRGDIDTERLVA